MLTIALHSNIRFVANPKTRNSLFWLKQSRVLWIVRGLRDETFKPLKLAKMSDCLQKVSGG